jgi:bifunctional non-homologous end joining protein LigD
VALDDLGRSSFQALQAFDMDTERPPIVFYAFDLLRLNGKDLRDLPIEEQKAKLAELFAETAAALRYSISFTKDIEELLGKARTLGLERLIGKRSALLVGFYEGKRLKFAGRVGTGFSDKLLRSLFADLTRIGVEKCPFYNVPAAGRSRWDQGLTAADMKTLSLGEAETALPGEIHGVDSR